MCALANHEPFVLRPRHTPTTFCPSARGLHTPDEAPGMKLICFSWTALTDGVWLLPAMRRVVSLNFLVTSNGHRIKIISGRRRALEVMGTGSSLSFALDSRSKIVEWRNNSRNRKFMSCAAGTRVTVKMEARHPGASLTVRTFGTLSPRTALIF